MLLFGYTGVGKSTILNLVTGNDAQTGGSPNGTTEENKIYIDELHGARPKWMDTVGLHDASAGQDPFTVPQSHLEKLKEYNVEYIHAR